MTIRNLAELAEASAERLGERTIYEIDGVRSTNLQILDRARRMQAALVDLGLEPGGRVVVLMMNHALLFPLMQGIFRAGGTAIPVMPQAAAAELRYVLADTEAQIVVVDADRLATTREAAAGLPHVRHIIVQGGADEVTSTPPVLRLDALVEAEPNRPIARFEPERAGRDALLVRHDRPAQGRAAVAREPAGQQRIGRAGGRARPLGGLARHAQRHADRAYLRRGDHERPAAHAQPPGRRHAAGADALVRARTVHGADRKRSLHRHGRRAHDLGAVVAPSAGRRARPVVAQGDHLRRRRCRSSWRRPSCAATPRRASAKSTG